MTLNRAASSDSFSSSNSTSSSFSQSSASSEEPPAKRSKGDGLLEHLTKTGRRRCIKNTSIDLFLKVAKWIPRSISPFVNLTGALHTALQCNAKGLRGTETFDPYTKQCMQVYHAIVEAVPGSRETLDNFEKDPDTLLILLGRMTTAANLARGIAALREGRVSLTAEDWPSFLYDDGPYNVDEFDIGLLRGLFLLKARRQHLNTPGPSAGIKAPIGKKNGLTRSTPETIAYAACQARFLLSKQAQWSSNDGGFFNVYFFNAAVALFDDEEWATDTFNYFDKHVFKPQEPKKKANGPSTTSVAALKALRARRRHAAASPGDDVKAKSSSPPRPSKFDDPPSPRRLSDDCHENGDHKCDASPPPNPTPPPPRHPTGAVPPSDNNSAAPMPSRSNGSSLSHHSSPPASTSGRNIRGHASKQRDKSSKGDTTEDKTGKRKHREDKSRT